MEVQTSDATRDLKPVSQNSVKRALESERHFSHVTFAHQIKVEIAGIFCLRVKHKIKGFTRAIIETVDLFVPRCFGTF
jgi:hypothetical protein